MEQRHLDINADGLSVRCKLFSHAHARSFDHMALVMHGFGGSKDTHSIEHLAEHLTSKHKSWGVLAFDWPAHGADNRKRLTAPESLEYLRLAVEYARDELGAEWLGASATSYGGYITLRYLAEVDCPFERIALRCPAIDMYHVMTRTLTADERDRIDRGKRVLVGFGRKTEIDQAFFDDLAAHDVREHEFFDVADRILIIHGTEDDTVPIADSRAFCDANVIELLEIEGAGHRFTNPKHMDLAIDATVKWLGSK